MTAPMPETMSPREKVELKPCPFCGDEPFDRGFRRWECPCGAQGPAGSKAAATDGWNRRASLASSGDHAELARLAERCTTGDPWYKEGDLCGRQTFEQFLPQDRAFIAAANPATILALIAENAALRASASVIEPELGDLEATNADLSIRLTEAERKLAEAVSILRDIAKGEAPPEQPIRGRGDG